MESTSCDLLIKHEISKFGDKPVDLIEMTERCDILEQSGKVVNSLLSFNVMTQADKFVTGMHLVKCLNDDLVSVRLITSDSKSKIDFLKHQILLKSAQAMILKRHKLRMQ